jgi:DNA-binding transcriptional ArsR family regulator
MVARPGRSGGGPQPPDPGHSRTGSGGSAGQTAPGDALAALLGFTRAAALAAIGTGCSTTELARRVGVSPAAASQHATVLRNAGLVASRREANTMMHSVTPLGSAVLNGA